VSAGQKGFRAGELTHRGQAIRNNLLSRRQIRRSRRKRKTRYRQPRFQNRTRPQGWMAPSLLSRVNNVFTWAKRLINFTPVSGIVVETVRFDTQLMQHPEISGVEYQQGELAGYEAREYLLEKWGRTCAYCGTGNVVLEVEHIVPRVKGGSVSHFCVDCPWRVGGCLNICRYNQFSYQKTSSLIAMLFVVKIIFLLRSCSIIKYTFGE
jgi:5-methylcytosine-specific restriction endonuclease McrA